MCSLHSFSQSFSGQITNTNKEPLENVYVYNLTSNSHTHTNVSGDFILENCKVGDSIEIQILGYQKLKFILNSLHFKKKTTFVLEAKVFLLDELVLTKKMDPIQTIVKIDLSF